MVPHRNVWLGALHSMEKLPVEFSVLGPSNGPCPRLTGA
eukprot:CAMPEP_0115710420 /NCGR_PEP_ID=MMETSP0272-20121206/73006_1 /TAXON_ID=71861 /ORGANISM="Scrippsiella trochoidea, Strain CCMP3099" /LENGTH=38 /DNA_ID= /DNA_START= /DNA_END= /DNA_ORIENTATION=